MVDTPEVFKIIDGTQQTFQTHYNGDSNNTISHRNNDNNNIAVVYIN